MSDGPHRSLKMPRGWKKLAECADKKAYAPEEVRDALPAALEQDWRAEVSDRLCRQVGEILGESQKLAVRRPADRTAGGSAQGYRWVQPRQCILDYAIQAAERGRTGDVALREAAGKALSDRAASGARQVEEHYHRETTQRRAAHVRGRIEAGVTQCDMAGIAGRVVGTDRTGGPRRPAKQTGIDEGSDCDEKSHLEHIQTASSLR